VNNDVKCKRSWTGGWQAKGYTGRLYHKQSLRLDVNHSSTSTVSSTTTTTTTTTTTCSTRAAAAANDALPVLSISRWPKHARVTSSSLSQQPPVMTQLVLSNSVVLMRTGVHSTLALHCCAICKLQARSLSLPRICYLFTRTAATVLAYLNRLDLLTSLLTFFLLSPVRRRANSIAVCLSVCLSVSLSVCNTITCESLDVEVWGYILSAYGSCSYMKVIRSRSRSQQQRRQNSLYFHNVKLQLAITLVL